MANQIPLIVNAGAGQIQQLATGDNLSVTANVVTGNILAGGYFYANGQPFSGGNGNIDLTQVTTDIIPVGNNMQSLGNATNQWQDIYVSNATIYFDSVPLTVDGSGALTFDGNSLVQSGPNVINTGNVETTGNVTGNYFIGDGSQLTNLPSGANIGNVTFDNINIIGTGNLHLQPDPANAGSYLDIFLTSGPDLHLVASANANFILGQDNTSNIRTSWDGNVTVQSWNPGSNTAGGTWTFGGTGNLTTPGNINFPNNSAIQQSSFDPSPGRTIETVTLRANVQDNATLLYLENTGNANLRAWQDINLNTYTQTRNNNWKFDASGDLTVPGNIIGGNANGILISSDGNVTLSSKGAEFVFDAPAGNLYLPKPNGAIVFPDDSVQTTAYTGILAAAGNAGDIQINVAGNIGADPTLRYVDTGGEMTLYADYLNAPGIFTSDIYAGDGTPSNITLTTSYGNATWNFGLDGNLTAPGNITTTSNVTANIFNLANAGNLTYSSIQQNQNPPYGSENLGIELLTTTDDANVFSSVSAGPDYVSLKSTNAGNANVVVQGGYGVTISTSNATGGAIKNWTFTSGGNALFPGALGTALDISTTGNVFSQGEVSAVGNIVTDGYFIGTFIGNVTGNFVVPGANTQVIFNTNGNADATGGMTFDKGPNLFTVLGTVSAQGNVISGNVLTSNIISAGGNITGSNFVTNGTFRSFGAESIVVNGNVSIGGNTSVGGNITGGNVTANYFIGNGSALTGIVGTYSNTNVQSYLQVLTSNISTTGNISSLNIFTSGLLSSSGNVRGANFNTDGNVSATGDISGNNVSLIGNIAARSISTTGDVDGFNVHAIGLITATGNIRGANFNTAGGVYAVGELSAGGHVYGLDAAFNGNLSAQGNIVGSSLTTLGNISATGAIIASNYSTAGFVSAGGNISAGNFSTAGNILGAGNFSVTGNAQAGNFSTAGNILGAGNFSVTGNAIAGNFTTAGNVSATGNIIGANVILGQGGVYQTGANAVVLTSNYSGSTTLVETTFENVIVQANTAVSILSSIGGYVNFIETGIEASGFISAVGNVYGDYATFSDIQLNDLSANAILYTDANRNVFNTDFSYDSTNNTMSGGNISVTGNVTAGYFYGDGSNLTGVGGNYGNSNVVTLLASYGSNVISTTGNVNTGNIVTGTGSGGNISGVNVMSANIFIGDGGNLTNLPSSGLVVDSMTSGANITASVNDTQYNVTALAVSANVTAPSGVAQDGQKLTYRIIDNGTPQTLTWDPIYQVIGTTLPTTTVSSKYVYVGVIYNDQDTTWDVVSVAQQA